VGSKDQLGILAIQALSVYWFQRPAGFGRRRQEYAKVLKKDEILAAMKKQRDELSAEIDALETRAHEVNEDARAKVQAQLVALRAKRQEGERKLEEMKSATESSWSRLKVEADNVWDAMKDSLSAFKGHFK
jgi:chromosome segregation ATPase